MTNPSFLRCVVIDLCFVPKQAAAQPRTTTQNLRTNLNNNGCTAARLHDDHRPQLCSTKMRPDHKATATRTYNNDKQRSQPINNSRQQHQQTTKNSDNNQQHQY